MFGNKKRSNTRIDSLVGNQTTLNGDVSFAGGLHVNGSILGNVTGDGDAQATLTVSEKGTIEGEVRVPHVLLIWNRPLSYERTAGQWRYCSAGARRQSRWLLPVW